MKNYNKIINKSDYFIVNWMLSNICNFKCCYCKEFLHSGTIKPPQLETCVKFLEKLKNDKPGKKICVSLAGGEPTTWNITSDFLRYCKKLGFDVIICSNGSSDIDWWIKNSKYIDCATLSYHSERNYFDKFYKNCTLCVKSIPDVRIDLLPLPQNFDEVFEKALILMSEYFFNALVTLRPVRIDLDGEIYNYSEEQIHKIISFGTNFVPQHTHFISAEKWFNNNFISSLLADAEITNKTNSWLGWNCNAGLESIFIEGDKIKYAINCSDEIIGTIDDEDFKFPSSSITCTKKYCQCRLNLFFSKECRKE